MRSSKRRSLYALALMAAPVFWGYFWGPAWALRAMATPLAFETAREALVWRLLRDVGSRSTLDATPELMVTLSDRGPLSVSQPFSAGIIAISTDMLHAGSDFTDSDLSAIVAHEIAHLENRDSFKLWTSASSAWHKDVELAADKRAAELVGCAAVRDLFVRHYRTALKHWDTAHDPHPHPDERIKALAKCADHDLTAGQVLTRAP